MKAQRLLLTCICPYLIIIFCAKTVQIAQEDRDFYWHSFTGEVPDDAIPGGLDAEGKITYIGRTMHKNDISNLVPGELNVETGELYYIEFGILFHTTENIEILCASNPELYEWVDYSPTNSPFLQNNLIVAGYPKHLPYLVGRKVDTNRTFVGRLYLCLEKLHTLFTYYDGNNMQFEQEGFEVLSPKPKKGNCSECASRTYHVHFH